jgi:hypothetical protein
MYFHKYLNENLPATWQNDDDSAVIDMLLE